MANRKLAIFDLDYTLTRRGTWGRFNWQLIKRRPHIWIPFLASALKVQRQYKKGDEPRVSVKLAMMRRSMQGLSKERLIAEAVKFAQREVPDKMRPGGLRQIKAHQDAGDKVVIISAAADIIVREIAIRLGVEDYMGTDMSWDSDGIVEMRFASPNCYGPEKVNRLKTYLETKPEYQNLPSIFYSDSHSDLPLMLHCDEAIAVHPSEKLKILAKEHDFPVADWDK